MMSRPVVLVFLLLILIITSQFEWKQQLANEIEVSPVISQRQQQISNREVVKEKIILSQEKNIQRLNELVRSLQLQLLQCRGSSNTIYDTGGSFTVNDGETEMQHFLEDK